MKEQVILSIISKEYQDILGDNLCGIYLHGSLAFGCFNWAKSDIDFLVVVYDEIGQVQDDSLSPSLFKNARKKSYGRYI